MTNIYANSSFDTPELEPDSVLDAFEQYATQLESVASNYRKLVNFIKTKNIKILEAYGHSHGGSFSVDEIDTARLKQAGFVIDLNEADEEKEPVFFVDSKLDEAIERERDAQEGFEQLHYNKNDIVDERAETEQFAFLDEDDEEDEDQEFELEDEHFPETSAVFNIQDILSGELQAVNDDLDIGSIEIELKKVDENRFSFNLIIADLKKNPPIVRFNRDKCNFKYQCGSCDSWHYESLESAFQSLRTVSALMSNLIALSEDCKELRAALDFLDHDLRLLQTLLKFDYAIDDFSGEEDL